MTGSGEILMKIMAVIAVCFIAFRAGHSFGWNAAIDMALERFPDLKERPDAD